MRITLALVPLLLAGCATTAIDAPSLMPRPIEARSDAETTAPGQPPAADPSLDARIAVQVAGFDSAAEAFEAAGPAIAAKLARGRGAAQGSDRWLDAQTALGELQQLRTATAGAMIELEALAIARASAGAPPYAALDAAIAAAQAELSRQQAREAGLKAQLN